LGRLGPTAAAREAKAQTPRDQGLLAAADVLFGEGDRAARRQQYAEAMGQLHARHPEDPDVASFYALALLGTMSRSLIGTADAHEGHSQALAGSDTQKRVEEILGRVLRAHPQHLGALHYVIHNDDDPAHARLALEAARTLTRLAPDSSHARHMPAHIFLQLGRWSDAAAADRSAVAASDAWIARKGLPPAMRNYHALQWLQYELLQLGRYREARATIDELAPVVKATGNVTLLSDLSSMRAPLCDRNRELAATGYGEQLRQRVRAVCHRHERGAQPQSGCGFARRAGARSARAGSARRRPAAGHRHHAAGGRRDPRTRRGTLRRGRRGASRRRAR
jgi:tetratricopeptide (TPR) repeat protein